ncbi:hypothetical protein FRC12_020747, partial [Ceratobasidium sp. 428]
TDIAFILFTTLYHPCVVAFDPSFVETRHVEDGSLAQVIRGKDLRDLFADTQTPITDLSLMMTMLSSSSSIRSGSSILYSFSSHTADGAPNPCGQFGQPMYPHQLPAAARNAQVDGTVPTTTLARAGGAHLGLRR